jgi:predicted flap endonuclease-1-like 5' DNA nuclease
VILESTDSAQIKLPQRQLHRYINELAEIIRFRHPKARFRGPTYWPEEQLWLIETFFDGDEDFELQERLSQYETDILVNEGIWLCVIPVNIVSNRRHSMANIEDIEGVGEAYATLLRNAGVKSVEALLIRGATPQGREELAAATGITKTLILEWVNHADLFRIKGVGSEFSDLLEEAGVDTVMELAQRNADNLHQKLNEVNVTKALVRRLPSLNQVRDWVDQAKQLPRVVEY